MESSNEKINLFISFLESNINSEDISQLFLFRNKDCIHYGFIKNGVRMIENSFDLEENTYLQNVLAIIQNEYSLNIVGSNLDSFTNSYIVTSWINNHLMLELGSDDVKDIKFIYNMVHDYHTSNVLK